MKRTSSLLLVVAVACALGEWSPVAAQFLPPPGGSYGPGYNRPRVSPYLNLLRGGSSAGVNYTTLVRPEFQTQAALNQLRYQTTQNQASIASLQGTPGGAVTTGHPVGFMTHLGYFQNYGGGGGPGFTIGGAGGSVGGQGYQGQQGRTTPTLPSSGKGRTSR